MNDSLGLREDSAAPVIHRTPPWTVLVVDDDPEVHSVTCLALDGFRFAGRGLRFLHAHSAAEARQVLASERGIAVLLLDVVMENDDSGLDVVSYVRDQLKNRFLRIVLRTGQPGQAPELDVITHYDINDYKHKTELTRQRLFTTIYTSLATYRDLVMLDANRRGLEKVIEASAHIFELRSMDSFAQGVLDQLIALLLFDADAVMLQASGLATDHEGSEHLRIVAGTGCFGPLIGREARAVLPLPVLRHIDAAIADGGCSFGSDHFVGVQHSPGSDLVFYVAAAQNMPEPDRNLLQMFFRNVAISRENLQRMASARGGRHESRAS